MRAYIAKEFTFDAAHQLPSHCGKCARLHGHTYRVVVTLFGEMIDAMGDSSEGMVVDFADLKEAFNEKIMDICDHRFLIPMNNQGVQLVHFPNALSIRIGDHITGAVDVSEYRLDYANVALLPIRNTTAECLAHWILQELHDVLPQVSEVAVYETPTSSATAVWEA